MNSLEAAIVVLEANGKPMHYKQITEKILELQLWPTNGKSPERTVNSHLATDINSKGTGSKVHRVAEAIYALREWGLPDFSGKKPVTLKGNVEAGEIDKSNNKSMMTFNDAAEYVLEHFGDQKPMHYEKITRKMIELGLIHTEGQTPEATLYAQVMTEVNRNIKRGETPRFVRHGKGLVGLQKWQGEGLSFQIKSHNEDVRKKLYKKLFDLSPTDFEALVARLLVAIGFNDVNVTSRSGDGGIDVRGTLIVGDVIKTKMAVQVKRWKKNIQAPTVQQVRGSLSTHEQGLIITTSTFSTGAIKEAQIPDKIPVALMNGEQFVALLIENDIGIHRIAYDLIDLLEEEITVP